MWEFELALALGVPHPSRLREMLSAEEWEEWRAFYEARPFGEYAQDARFAMIAALIATALSGKRYRPEDFMLVRPPRPRPTYERLKAALMLGAMVNRAPGGG